LRGHRSLRITLIADAFLEAEIDRLDDPAATSDFAVLAQCLDRHLVNRFPTDLSLGRTAFSVSLSLGCAELVAVAGARRQNRIIFLPIALPDEKVLLISPDANILIGRQHVFASRNQRPERGLASMFSF
jgi:hypothetical protein